MDTNIIIDIVIIIVMVAFNVLFIWNFEKLYNRNHRLQKEVTLLREKCVSLKSIVNKMDKKITALEISNNSASFQLHELSKYSKQDNSVDVSTNNKSLHTTVKAPINKIVVSHPTIYLGINSRELFFDVKDHKEITSKYVGTLLSEDEAEFDLIEIERIRSVETDYTLSLKGNVSLKDARSFVTEKKGKIRKVKDEQGETCWEIKSPIVVEFKK